MEITTNTQNTNTAAAFFLISNEQLQQVAHDAAAAVAAKYESERTDKLCTPTQAAEILQVSKSTLWRWSNCGILHPQQIGGKVFYKYSELMQQRG